MAEDQCNIPDDHITNPLYVKDDDHKTLTDMKNSESDKMKIAGLIIQALTLFLVAVVLIVGIIILAILFTTPTVDTVCPTTAPLTTADLSADSANISSTCPSTFSKENKSVLLDGISKLLEITSNASEKSDFTLYDIIGSLANLRKTVTTTSGAVSDILLAIEDILDTQNKTFPLRKVSCKDVKTIHPNSPSGYYHINGTTVYCNMDTLCGSGGGWTRIGYMDMTDATQSCPAGYRLYQSGNVRACGRAPYNGPSCTPPVKFDPNGIGYSEICGRVIGYQYASPNAVDNLVAPTYDINSYYVDGVSITRGSPRQHVWTFICGLLDSNNLYGGKYNCPCNDPSSSAQIIPSFVGNDYFCESGCHAANWSTVLYTGDPLWDGEGCGSLEGPCCAAPGLPWFHRDYGNVITTDYIELRICCDQSTDNEDVPISFYEIYVK